MDGAQYECRIFIIRNKECPVARYIYIFKDGFPVRFLDLLVKIWGCTDFVQIKNEFPQVPAFLDIVVEVLLHYCIVVFNPLLKHLFLCP